MKPLVRAVLLGTSLLALGGLPLGSMASAEPKKGGNLVYAYVSGPGYARPLRLQQRGRIGSHPAHL